MNTNRVRIAVAALLTGLALVVASALAVNPIGIDCSAMPFDDGEDDAGVLKPIEEVGIDLEVDGGLVLVLVEEDAGALGNALVPCYEPEALPKDAMDRVIVHEFLCRVCVAREVPDGLTFVIDDVGRAEVQATTLARLEAIGCTIGEAFATHAFEFTCAGENLHAVFSQLPTGTQVYLGY